MDKDVALKIAFMGILGFILLISFLYVSTIHMNRVSYDCRLAEISPDYPPAIKNECREMMSKQYGRS